VKYSFDSLSGKYASPVYSTPLAGVREAKVVAARLFLSALAERSSDAAVPLGALPVFSHKWGLKADGTHTRFDEIVDEMPLVGSGSIGSRIWTGASITVIGLDAPPVDGAAAAVQSHARAVLNVRVHPQQDATEAQAAVIAHLEAQEPFGVAIKVTAGATGDGFRASGSGPARDAMAAAMKTAWGTEPVEIATGGAIPLVKAIADMHGAAVSVSDNHPGTVFEIRLVRSGRTSAR